MRIRLALWLIACGVTTARADDAPYGSAELIEMANAEGNIFFYSVNFTETEQPWIKAFNKRFPFVAVHLTRAPGGQLITRIRTEAAAGKLEADVIDYSDRGHLLTMLEMYQDYAPPNAADYQPASLSREGQEAFVRDSGGFSALINGPVPDGLDVKAIRPWYPKMEDYIQLQASWIAEWNTIHGYRQ